MFGVEITDYDKKVYEEELKDFLPDNIVDVHVHLWEENSKRDYSEDHKGMQSWPDLVAPFCLYEDLMKSYEQMFPGKTVKPVLMTEPTTFLDRENKYIQSVCERTGLPSFYCISYDTDPEDIRDAITNRGFNGIKPYLNNCPDYLPTDEVRIFDFCTPEQLKVVDELGAAVMMHIPRSGRLKDPVNLAQMVEMDEKYPNAKIIIAHIGRAYCEEDFGNGFEVLSKTKNLYVDFTANTQYKAMVEAIKAVGPKRFMFGSDMPITKMRMYRICENGTYINVVPRGKYGDVSDDPHMRETDEKDITSFMYEELRAFKKAAEELKLSKADIADIMCNNSAKIFGINF